MRFHEIPPWFLRVSEPSGLQKRPHASDLLGGFTAKIIPNRLLIDEIHPCSLLPLSAHSTRYEDERCTASMLGSVLSTLLWRVVADRHHRLYIPEQTLRHLPSPVFSCETVPRLVIYLNAVGQARRSTRHPPRTSPSLSPW